MTLWLIAAFVGGFALRSAGGSVARAVEARRRPVQVLLGRVFPHPDDERWVINGDPRFMSCGTVHIGNDGSLWIDKEKLTEGPAVARYRSAIDAAYRARTLAKALEAIP